jgi:lysophospholipase L1-like esterase
MTIRRRWQPDWAPMTSRPVRVAVALVIPLAAVLTSCAAERGDATSPPFEDAATTSIGAPAGSSTATPIQSIAMVGDSITNGSKVELLEQLATLGVEIKAIDAEDSRRIAAGDSITPGLDVVRALAAGDAPDLWVIALGTNDVGMGPEVYTSGIAELIAAIPAGAPIVWVDVYVAHSPDASAAFNETLRAALDARGQSSVVEWAELADEDGVLRDGIHPSGYGIEQFAEMVTAAVGDWMS